MTPNKSKKYTLSSREKETIIEAIVSFFNAGVEDAAFVYLFGSFASNEEFSDIDLGIVTLDPVNKPLDFELELESTLERIIKYPVDVRILNKAPFSFIQNVIRNGKVILDRDPNRRADFESNVLKQYFDFSRFRDQYLREVLNAPV